MSFLSRSTIDEVVVWLEKGIRADSFWPYFTRSRDDIRAGDSFIGVITEEEKYKPFQSKIGDSARVVLPKLLSETDELINLGKTNWWLDFMNLNECLFFAKSLKGENVQINEIAAKEMFYRVKSEKYKRIPDYSNDKWGVKFDLHRNILCALCRTLETAGSKYVEPEIIERDFQDIEYCTASWVVMAVLSKKRAVELYPKMLNILIENNMPVEYMKVEYDILINGRE